MSDVVSLELIGRNVRQLQADVRTLRNEIAFTSKRIDQIIDRVATFEAVFETRLDQQTILIDQRFDQLMEMMKSK
jgi:uncharacterized protein YlxW (UPF0749 family)